jgi:hypothetical protein
VVRRGRDAVLRLVDYRVLVHNHNTASATTYTQGDHNVSVHLMITVQKARKAILNSINHLP